MTKCTLPWQISRQSGPTSFSESLRTVEISAELHPEFILSLTTELSLHYLFPPLSATAGYIHSKQLHLPSQNGVFIEKLQVWCQLNSDWLLCNKWLLPASRISLAETEAVKLKQCHQAGNKRPHISTKPSISFISTLDLCAASREPLAKAGMKIDPAVCFNLFNYWSRRCNQQSAKLKVRNSGCNKWLMAECNCRGWAVFAAGLQ